MGGAGVGRKNSQVKSSTPATSRTRVRHEFRGRGSGFGVHAGVARGLTFSVDLCQDRTPSHPDAAEVRPCHPDQAAQMELAERHLCVQERCLKVLAVNHEVVRQEQLLRRRWR